MAVFLQETTPAFENVMRVIQQQYLQPRNAEEIHVSDLIYCLRKAWFGRVEQLPPSPQETMYFITGWGLQAAMLQNLRTEVITLDGIMMTPDYWNGDAELLELKTTMVGEKRLVANDFPETWLTQIMCYMKGTGLIEATLLVFQLMQRKPYNFRIKCTLKEIDDNWAEVVRKKGILQAAIKAKAPPVPCNAGWECTGCRFELKCKSVPVITTAPHKLAMSLADLANGEHNGKT